jgi:hypothetical protein
MRRAELTANVAYFYGFEEEGVLDIESVNQVPRGQISRREERELAKLIFEEIDFVIQVEGSYERLIQFAHDLRKGAKILRIEDIGMSPANTSALAEDRLRATFTVNALGEKPEGASPPSRPD